MDCEEVLRRLDAYVDGELTVAERRPLEGHLSGCARCGAEAAALARLSRGIRDDAPRYRASDKLRAQIRGELRQAPRPTARSPRRIVAAFAYAASVLLAVAVGSGGTVLLLGQQRSDSVADELLEDHLRSLLAAHLTDVASSDQHTVKPWFAGHSDLSPPVVDLTADGFPLVGGRLDLVAGRPVPALVYRRRKHIINLFVLPAAPGGHGGELGELARHGYHLIHWDQGDLSLWAVSDAAPGELADFARLYRTATAG